MDFVSCRNLLIYLDAALQKRITRTLHYALKPGGFLMLGASETVFDAGEFFNVLDKSHKLYSRKFSAVPNSVRLPPRATPSPETAATESEASRLRSGAELNAQREADRIALARYAPAGVLVNRDMEILQFRGGPRRQSGGRPAHQPAGALLSGLLRSCWWQKFVTGRDETGCPGTFAQTGGKYGSGSAET